MPSFKIFIIGFWVSLLGSLPLGYLNLIALEIYVSKGLLDVFCFFAGVVTVELFVILATVYFAEQLKRINMFKKWIDLFSMLFFFALALVFFFNPKSSASAVSIHLPDHGHSSFGLGLISNSLNIAQIPFWLGWVLQLSHKNLLNTKAKTILIFSTSAILGTTMGMFSFVMGFKLLLENASNTFVFWVQMLIPCFFLGMGIVQACRLFKSRNQFMKSTKVLI